MLVVDVIKVDAYPVLAFSDKRCQNLSLWLKVLSFSMHFYLRHLLIWVSVYLG